MDSFQVNCDYEDGSCATCIDTVNLVCTYMYLLFICTINQHKSINASRSIAAVPLRHNLAIASLLLTGPCRCVSQQHTYLARMNTPYLVD